MISKKIEIFVESGAKIEEDYGTFFKNYYLFKMHVKFDF
jgi:hypothetical protein